MNAPFANIVTRSRPGISDADVSPYVREAAKRAAHQHAPNTYCWKCGALLPTGFYAAEDRVCDKCRPSVEAARAANGLSDLIFGRPWSKTVCDYVGECARERLT